MKQDVYQRITDQIIAQLEAGVRPWQRPWTTDHLDGRVSLPLRHNGVPYRGVNIIALWMQGIAKGYQSPRWMTFKRALDLGGHVRKGEQGSVSVYADTITRSEHDTISGEESTTTLAFMKAYTVFNVEQIDGLPASYYTPSPPLPESATRNAAADAFFTATGATIVHGGARACYVMSTDTVQMPPIECFADAEAYYATLAHECTHWTMPEQRLARSFDRKRFGDAGYAMEELVAELGAAFVCAALQLTPELRDDHASYVAHWLNVLRNDKRAIFTAAGHAQRAADYLSAFSDAARLAA